MQVEIRRLPARSIAAERVWGGGNDKTTGSAAGPQRLDVTARDFALKINGSPALRPGAVTITARNTGKQAHGMVLVKLNDGVDDADAARRPQEPPRPHPEPAHLRRWHDALPTGTPWQATTSFDPGNYAMLDVGTSAQGRYNFTRAGEVQGFTVSGKKLTSSRSGPAPSVALYDYGIDMPKVIPASGRIKVENTGDDDHQLAVIPVRRRQAGQGDPARVQDRQADAPSGRRGRSRSWRPTSSATSSTVSYHLPKGAYIAYCAYRSQQPAAAGRTRASAWSRRSRFSSYAQAAATSVLPGSSTPPSSRTNGSMRSSSVSRKRVWSAGDSARSVAEPVGDRSTNVSKTSSRDG